ncbi:MAG: putative Protein SAP1 [Streblomastix strix]|uniref:AAA+ ATPase domain-containing protein n=1 Tax=Streblomastix strix TaxID=222440 RepID=A0A5J4V6P1_9EUKA|nr:MAG: putative Protein SAP1 [Streblomastix strix]
MKMVGQPVRIKFPLPPPNLPVNIPQQQVKQNQYGYSGFGQLSSADRDMIARVIAEPTNQPQFQRQQQNLTVQNIQNAPQASYTGVPNLDSYIKTLPPQRQQAVQARLSSLDKKHVESVCGELVGTGKGNSTGVTFEDVVGSEQAKQLLMEMVIFPMLRPDLFTGIRAPPRGLLLFGPPGTGKTLLCKALATKADCRFFALSASSLTSKWVGEGEKTVKALFEVAAAVQPSIIFLDEIDSILTERSSEENEASRRMKTEFLIKLDGMQSLSSSQSQQHSGPDSEKSSTESSSEDRVVFIGATNRPFDLDTAVLRRLPRRVYLPLPSRQMRIELVQHTLVFSNADLVSLCKDSALSPVREIMSELSSQVKSENVRPITLQDFQKSIGSVRPSVNNQVIVQFEKWNKDFGSSQN